LSFTEAGVVFNGCNEWIGWTDVSDYTALSYTLGTQETVSFSLLNYDLGCGKSAASDIHIELRDSAD